MWLCGEAATWETGNWKLGAHLKCISFVKNVGEAPGRFRSVDFGRYIKTGSSQCAAIRVLESRNRKIKNVSFLGTSRIRRLSRKADPGNPEIRKARRPPRPQQSPPSPAFERLCARCRIAAGTYDASCNTRAAAVLRDEVPVTGGDDAPSHGTALASCRCCGGPSAMQHIGCDHACSAQARTSPQTPLASVAPQSECDQRISSFRVSRLTTPPPLGS